MLGFCASHTVSQIKELSERGDSLAEKINSSKFVREYLDYSNYVIRYIKLIDYVIETKGSELSASAGFCVSSILLFKSFKVTDHFVNRMIVDKVLKNWLIELNLPLNKTNLTYPIERDAEQYTNNCKNGTMWKGDNLVKRLEMLNFMRKYLMEELSQIEKYVGGRLIASVKPYQKEDMKV